MAGPSTSGSAPQPAAAANPNALIVSSRQRGNPVLKEVKAVPWIYGATTADFLIPDAACALFLSLRYHLLHPNYLLGRLRELRENAPLRLVLLLVDSEAPEKPILQARFAAATAAQEIRLQGVLGGFFP
jgi:DNA excision repair protein ERCC-1